MKEWLTLEDLTGHLKMSRATLYKMAQQGKIPAVKVGRGWRFDREAVDQWLEGRGPKHRSQEFPWQDCLDLFAGELKGEFGNRFASVWVYGSWARHEAHLESDIDLLVVMDPLQPDDSKTIRDLAYQATFGRNRLFVFSVQVVGQRDFLTEIEPLLLNVRKEGLRAA